jgi:hypothetical protein
LTLSSGFYPEDEAAEAAEAAKALKKAKKNVSSGFEPLSLGAARTHRHYSSFSDLLALDSRVFRVHVSLCSNRGGMCQISAGAKC